MDQINILELMQLKMRLENYFILILKAKTNVELMPRLCYLNRLLTLLPLRRYRDSLPFYRELVIFTEDSLFLPRTRYFYLELVIFTENILFLPRTHFFLPVTFQFSIIYILNFLGKVLKLILIILIIIIILSFLFILFIYVDFSD